MQESQPEAIEQSLSAAESQVPKITQTLICSSVESHEQPCTHNLAATAIEDSSHVNKLQAPFSTPVEQPCKTMATVDTALLTVACLAQKQSKLQSPCSVQNNASAQSKTGKSFCDYDSFSQVRSTLRRMHKTVDYVYGEMPERESLF